MTIWAATGAVLCAFTLALAAAGPTPATASPERLETTTTPQVTVTQVSYRAATFSLVVSGSDYFKIWMEYGTSPDYGTICCESVNQAGDYTHTLALVTLEPGTTYHIRGVARDGLGCCGEKKEGPNVTFTTKAAEPPELVTQETRWVSDCFCELVRGVLSANGAPTTITYEYGTTQQLGSSTPAETFEADVWGQGTQIQGFMRDLTPGSTYYWRAVLVNQAGTTRTPVSTFTTGGPPSQAQPQPPPPPPNPTPPPLPPAAPPPPPPPATGATTPDTSGPPPQARPQTDTAQRVRARALLTPGLKSPLVTQATIGRTICSPGWVDGVKPSVQFMARLKLKLMRSYDLAGPSTRYTTDHLIPLELGGAPRDPRNLWPQVRTRASAVDLKERILSRSVCAGRITLATAQLRIIRLKRRVG